MPLNSLLLQNVHENVHVFSMKLNYSEPKIYTGGVDISTWSKLTAKQKNNALERPWYLYFSFRDPSSAKLVRRPNIKAGTNRFKIKTELEMLQQSLIQLLRFI